MTVDVQTTYNVSTANGVSDTFAYSFKILSADDIQVYLDGVLATYLTDYTLTGVGSGSGGTVVMTAVPANGTIVLRERNTVLERTTDYQQSGDFQAATVNPDFDRLWMAAQDVSRRIDFSLHFSSDVSGWSFDIPEPTADYALFGNAAGNALEWRAVGSIELAVPADQSVTVAKMSASQTNILFGRETAGSGAGEEIACTAAGRAMIAAASAAAQRVLLGTKFLQYAYAETATYTAVASPNVIPADDTIPQRTEGAELLTATITPTSASSKIIAIVKIPAVTDAAGDEKAAALFSSQSLDAIDVAYLSDAMQATMEIVARHSPATTSAVTYSVRVGVSGAGGNLYINGDSVGRKYGGVMKATLTLIEVE